jgi:hypothetical protein
MPQIKPADRTARARLRQRTSAADARTPFREAIAGLQGDDVLEVRPEDRETMRGLKLNVTRAARETNVDVTYGETTDGALLVWRRAEGSRRRRRRSQ